jgi:hypothetical protein
VVDGGISGRACKPGGSKVEAPGVPISKRNPLTFNLWLRPDASDTDVAILSAADYSSSSASVTYGKGIELRLVQGEFEFRFGDRFPAYSIRVRSEGANLQPEQWRNLTLVYEGAAGRETGRAEASWVRMFVDGRELPTSILNEGVALPEAKSDKPGQVKFRIGWDNEPKSPKLRSRRTRGTETKSYAPSRLLLCPGPLLNDVQAMDPLLSCSGFVPLRSGMRKRTTHATNSD